MFSYFYTNATPLKRFRKILGYTLLVLIFLLLSVFLLVQTSLVQNWLVGKATYRLSKALKTRVEVKHVNFSLFNKMSLEGVYVGDRNKDTLLYAGAVNVRITDWFFLKDAAELKYIGLDDASIRLVRTDSIWNYQFLADYFSDTTTTTEKKKGISFDLKKVELNNIRLLKRDGWRGEDMALYLRALRLDAKEVNFEKKLLDVNSLAITEPVFSITNYKGNRPYTPVTVRRPAGDTALYWNPGEWRLLAADLSISNGMFKTGRQGGRPAYYYFDGSHIQFNHINARFKNLALIKDTLTARINLSTQERSGFDVKSFRANVKWQPRAMEFVNLDIRTNKSHLTHYFVMRYDQFDDMDDFIGKVHMQGVFKDALVHSDDIAYFAPELAGWKKDIHLTGTIRGTVDNLTGKGVLLRAGSKTLLNGDIAMKGLPDINKTYIDFTSNDFRTDWADASTIIPQLKEVKDVRLDKLQYLRFTGRFIGYINNFIASGTTETALGTVVTDVNMKFPEKGSPSYTGKVTTHGFNLGSFIGNDQVGAIAFDGMVKGSSFSMKNMQADLDGTISSIGFNGYNYQNIKVKGTMAKRLFNGELVAADPNVSMKLNGLVDFSHKEPVFNFFASVDKANLKRLKLYGEDIDFNGNFRFDFTGSDIDKFLGTAKIYDASVFRNGHRISFDSLTIESRQIDNSKSIVVVSNEFDAALVGEYSIKELPAAFQTFLHRYYPSYIKASPAKLNNENFSFVITTRKVDEYLGLFNKNLNGFNNTNLSGRINTKDNLFDLDADVPQFSYRDIAFYNVNLKGRGTYDSLALATNIGEVFVNDSLHFPGTKINVRASNDVSKITVTTSASQTLNSASLSGTLHTMQNGFSVVFDPSTFDINGKRWTIDNGGELALSRDIVTTDGLKIYSGDQQVLITSHPSEISNGSDLSIDLKKVNIGDFAPFFVKSDRLEGLLTGKVAISDPFGLMNVDVKAEAEQFRFNDDSIGKIQLGSTYVKSTGRITLNAVSANKDYDFDVNGIVNINDSTGAGIDITTHPRRLSIHPLEQYLTGIFSNVKGFASGDLRITGKGNNLKYLGKLTLTDGELMVDYTKCRYRIPQATVALLEDRVDFGNFQIKDDLNNTGEVQTGKLYHSNFKDMSYDFRVVTNRMLLLNTTMADNNQFYGRAIGRADFRFRGPQEDMEMEISAEPTDSSAIYLPTANSRIKGGEADFLSWKVYGKEMAQTKVQKSESSLSVHLKMTANNLARINVILDEAAGDQISAVGHGVIDLRAGTRENLTLNGRLDINKGDYTFSFQSIKRRFKLSENASNYLLWNGDPYNATLQISAEYLAEKVRFSDLGLNSNAAYASVLSTDVKQFQGDVLVIAKIKNTLKDPKIDFDIQLPKYSPMANVPDAATVLSLITRDENERNKQVSLLIVFNSFGPLSTTKNTNFNIGEKGFEGIVVNSFSSFLSAMLTRQFSSRLQNMLKDPTIRVNISASIYNGNSINDLATQSAYFNTYRSNLALSINKSYFNERLTFIVGSSVDFGFNNAVAAAAGSNLQFLPDVNAQLKLTPDGKFVLNFFYRQNTSYTGTTTLGKQSRSGAGISFRKDFDSLNELFKKKK